jgi:hypothetical protein
MRGFSVPGSRSGSYVASRRDEEGSFGYDKAAIELGIQKQTALQNLSETYAQTIDNAYASYLANQRNIMASAMGQGYKQAYLQGQEQALSEASKQAAQTAASARAQFAQEESEARNYIQQQYEAEVSNIDRALNSMDNYFEYLKGLSSENATVRSLLGIETNVNNLFDTDYSDIQLDTDMYERLLQVQPRTFKDAEGQAGKSYMEWMTSQLKDTSVDRAYSQWLYGGGWEEVLRSLGTSTQKAQQNAQLRSEAKLKAEAEQKAKEEAAKKQANRPYKKYGRHGSTGRSVIPGVIISE